MKNIFKTIALGAIMAALASCDLSEYSHDDASVYYAFNSEANIDQIVNGFFGGLYSVTSIYGSDPGSVDYVAVSSLDARFTKAYNANTVTQKLSGFDDLRNYNYFIDKINSDICTVSDAAKANYEAIARWFRAEWYYSKLKSWGDVQWYDHVVLSTNLDDQYKDRDPRSEVVSHIIDDLEYAYANMTHTSADKSTIDKWCAEFLLMRVCLFEGSWQKYHEDNVSASQTYFEKAYSAAKEIMDNGGFSLADNYRQLFTSATLDKNEVLLGGVTGTNIRGSQNNYFNFQINKSLVRPFVNTYLMKDGTPYTTKYSSDYQTMKYSDEFTDRDPRLAQTVRNPQYQFNGSLSAGNPDFQVAPLGYQAIKWIQDRPLSSAGDDSQGDLNETSVPAYRYAEVLLDYAEAKAELGTLTDDDWAKTVGAIRKRAGITGGLTTKPSTVDSYLQKTFYPNVTDASILEIRRERAIEFCLENMRTDDLKRWNCSQLVANLPWTGMHIDALDVPIDLNGDGVDDVYFSKNTVDKTSKYASIWVQVGKETVGLDVTSVSTGGYDLIFKIDSENRVWEGDYRDLAPMPADVMDEYTLRGYKLSQNPGYEQR